jgi:hypothetical protein
MRVRQDDPMGTPVTVVTKDGQVAAKPRRRTYTAEYKRRILKEVATTKVMRSKRFWRLPAGGTHIAALVRAAEEQKPKAV